MIESVASLSFVFGWLFAERNLYVDWIEIRHRIPGSPGAPSERKLD